MAVIDMQYQNLLKEILNNGYEYTDHSRGVTCRQISSYTLDIDMQRSFPLLTLKKMYWKSIVTELLWFLNGSSNIDYLLKYNVTIWNKDAYNYYKTIFRENGAGDNELLSMEEFLERVKLPYNERIEEFDNFTYCYGDVGANYGWQWRNFAGIEGHETDQIIKLIQSLQHAPFKRRHIVTAWNPSDLDMTALPPCHWSFEVIPDSETTFTLKWHQRSVDTFLGLPFDIASYALLAGIIGLASGMRCTRLIGDLSNVHLYENAIEPAKELLKLNPWQYPSCSITIPAKMRNLLIDLSEIDPDEFVCNNYESYPSKKVEMLAPVDDSSLSKPSPSKFYKLIFPYEGMCAGTVVLLGDTVTMEFFDISTEIKTGHSYSVYGIPTNMLRKFDEKEQFELHKLFDKFVESGYTPDPSILKYES